MNPATARTIWHHVETVNAVTYFAAECRDAPASVGLKGFWMGYFACRAAPMGAVDAGVVEATFFNFHPARVRRAIPDAWSFASPAAVREVRARAAAAALRRLAPEVEAVAPAVVALLADPVASADAAGRPLFAANRSVPLPDDPVAALWQTCTTLREHRGDSHVALLTGAGLDGCEAHVLFAAGTDLDPTLFLESRGWSMADWEAASARMSARGAGPALRDEVEQRTDELAIVPYERLGDAGVAELLALLRPTVDRVVSSGELRYPNPMGLPQPTSDSR